MRKRHSLVICIDLVFLFVLAGILVVEPPLEAKLWGRSIQLVFLFTLFFLPFAVLLSRQAAAQVDASNYRKFFAAFSWLGGLFWFSNLLFLASDIFLQARSSAVYPAHFSP
jgi:hypothetical protein